MKTRMRFELLSAILDQEPVAEGDAVRLRQRLIKAYGPGAWREMRGAAKVRLPNGAVRVVELHWYEAEGLGERDLKIKRYLGET
jgi:hypothetical protein